MKNLEVRTGERALCAARQCQIGRKTDDLVLAHRATYSARRDCWMPVPAMTTSHSVSCNDSIANKCRRTVVLIIRNNRKQI